MHPNQSGGQGTEDLYSRGVLLAAFQESHWENLLCWLSEQAGYSMDFLILSAVGAERPQRAQLGCTGWGPVLSHEQSQGDSPGSPHSTS